MISPDKATDTSDIDLTHLLIEDADEANTETVVARPTTRDSRFGKIVGGRYRIQERLGKGGMASVYRAVNRLDGSEYAVKILDPGYARDPAMARRCQREARAMADLANDHIPCAYAVGTTDAEETYIVMEFLRGRDLEQMIALGIQIPWRRAFRIALQLCDALQAAHSRNIIHRDVKPSNCFISDAFDGDEDRVKLIDFGIAKDLAGSVDPTGTGMVLGTPGYLAPELVKGESTPSALTDVYSLGVTLYKLLTHRLPWEGRNYDLLVSQRQHAPCPVGEKMASFGRRMPWAAEIVVMTAFAENPAERYPSARAFARALREVMEDYPEDADQEAAEPGTAGADASAPEAQDPPVPSTRKLAAEPEAPRLHAWRHPLVAAACFVTVLWAVPATPARPLAPSAAPLLALPAASPDALSAGHPPPPDAAPTPMNTATDAPPQAPQRPARSPEETPAPRPRPFKSAGVQKEVEDEQPYLLRTCAPKAPGHRTLVFTLDIAPSGRLKAVQAKPKALARCVQELWRHARFDASDEGGSYTHRLSVPPPLRELNP